jgi:hypothetical protein
MVFGRWGRNADKVYVPPRGQTFGVGAEIGNAQRFRRPASTHGAPCGERYYLITCRAESWHE